MKKKVFIYVGHANWGKSMALKIITSDSSRQKTTVISNHIIRVRKMSNDDDGEGLLNWVKDFRMKNYQRFIIAFCPKFPPILGEATIEQNIALDILIELQKESDLFFFVQKEKYNEPNHIITNDEINWLKNFSKSLLILEGQNENSTRAIEFTKFIEANIN